MKYTHAPSADHCGGPWRLSMAAPSSRRSLPSAFITQTWVSSMVVSEDVSGRVVASIAIADPSGDQTGWDSTPFVSVTRRTLARAMLTAKTS